METLVTEGSGDNWGAVAAASATAEAERAQDALPPRTFIEPLKCKLTEVELLKAGQDLVASVLEVDRITAEKRDANAEFRDRTKAARLRVKELSVLVESGEETRPITVVEQKIVATNTVRYTRSDTGEMYRERAMTLAERQTELPLEPADPLEITDPESVLGPEEDQPKPRRRRKAKG